ncbi:hypothetical protein B0H13DRAFT_1595562, partial [Mycena leptocephala]
VKVPVGKHCGFVQFVRKADAAMAIEKMQGFPVGGSRIRLSWGRSQCMYLFLPLLIQDPRLTHLHRQSRASSCTGPPAAALRAAPPPPQQQQRPGVSQPVPAGLTPAALAVMTPERAIILLQKFGMPGLDQLGLVLGQIGPRPCVVMLGITVVEELLVVGL